MVEQRQRLSENADVPLGFEAHNLMDLATIIGLISGSLVIGAAIVIGGSPLVFVNIPSVLIVIGGMLAATVIRFTMASVMEALSLGAATAFSQDRQRPTDVIDMIVELAEMSRRSGPLALEQAEIDDDFTNKAVRIIVDGHPPEVLTSVMARERDQNAVRLEEGERIFRAMGDAAPAFGMIGTLVGLVQMLATMDDPSTIGPSMAVALLTTLYGAVLANLICLPIADKLSARIRTTYMLNTIALEGVAAIQDKQNPRLIRDALESYLPDAIRSPEDEDLAPAGKEAA